MKTITKIPLAIMLFFMLHYNKSIAQTQPDSLKQLHIQLVFALDATGSMSGLIAAAKQKIWSIASSLAQTNPAPDIEMGMVFYRDKGDLFENRIVPLSKNMDAVYAELIGMTASGGGDSPESVNLALFKAVNGMEWNMDTTVLKYIFLVGDCPPHMDYDEVKYPVTCSKATEKGIIINTILMGNDVTAGKIWKEIAECSGGEFMQTDMSANNFEVTTPYDAEIKSLSEQVDGMRIYYGKGIGAQMDSAKAAQADKFKTISTAESARRADFNMMNDTNKSNYYGSYELLSDVKANKVKLADLKPEELPAFMASMSLEQRTVYINEQIVVRDSLEKRLTDLLALRQQYVQGEISKMDKGTVDDSFNSRVYNNISKSAKKKGYRTASCPRF